MSKNMWNRIFKTKSNSKALRISKKPPIPNPCSISSGCENRLSYFEEFQNSRQNQQIPNKEETSLSEKTTIQTSKKPQSKFSKVVNTFTLKRNSKDNQIHDEFITTSKANDTNQQMEGNLAEVPNTDKIGTPTTSVLIQPGFTIESNEELPSLELHPCTICSRTFVRKALEKHIKICEKTAAKKRKIFDSSRQRREGTELASYPLPKDYGLPPIRRERDISPKPMQAAQSTKTTPEGSNVLTTDNKSLIPKSSKKVTTPSQGNTPSSGTPTTFTMTTPKESRPIASSVKKRIMAPAAEACPYCDRCFGVKAYDRHVEWCKEKALIASFKQQNKNAQDVAKERLEARTKYRAPLVKTKRSVNRDKYSYSYDDDNYFGVQTSVDDNQKSPMNSSMTSSFMSDSIASDNYDPFVSAKRQLEELCSPSSPIDDNVSTTSHSVASCKSPNIPVTSTSNKMTSSFTSRGTLNNPRAVVTTPKSNFHRTSSLRGPRRSPLPISSRHIFFPSSQKQRSTIQRGLSDEGPISSNFLKPEEFDEIPVRSVCVNEFAISNTPRVIRRDPSAAPNRNALALNLPNVTQSNKKYSPTPSNNLLKTDSLAIFLKHENEAKEIDSGGVNTKELKDKSNALSKQNSTKSVISTDDRMLSSKADIPQTNAKPNTLKLKPIERHALGDSRNQTQTTKLLQAQTVDSEKLTMPCTKLDSLSYRNLDSGYIDPKLINAYDNLPMEMRNELASSSSSSPPYSNSDHNDGNIQKNSGCGSSQYKPNQTQLDIEKVLIPETFQHSGSNRSSSGDNRNQLKRKIRLGRNQFLYDASPEAFDNNIDDEVNNRSCESDRQNSLGQTSFYSNLTHTDTTSNLPPFSPSTFNEFDFDEFLSSFDKDDENFPSLFKDCREFLMNRSSLNKPSNVENISSYRSARESFDNSGQKYERDVQLNLDSAMNKKRGEIFISIETDHNDNDTNPINDPLVAANPRAQIEEVQMNDNKFQRIEVGYELSNCMEGEEDDSRLRMSRIQLMNDFPSNISLNNAKNLKYPMDQEFTDQPNTDVEQNSDCRSSRQTAVDSDERSNSDSPSTRKGDSGATGGRCVAAKQSADSAYGSLSRQSTTVDAISSHRSAYSNRVKQSSAPHDSFQADFQYPSSTSLQYSSSNNNEVQRHRSRDQSSAPQKIEADYQYPSSSSLQYASSNNNEVQRHRSRNLSIESSSSESSLPPISSNHQEQHRVFHRNPLSSFETKNTSSKSSPNSTSRNSSAKNLKPLSATTTSNVKASKFCHECGSKFLLDQAKFCMDCGVRRIVL